MVNSGFKFSQLEMSASLSNPSLAMANESTEVVLATMIKNFEFSASKNDNNIFWETTSISSPAVMVGVTKYHQLPLKVARVGHA